MELRHFYGTAPALPVAGAVPFGGEVLELRPLRAVDVWELWDSLRPHVSAWAEFFLAAGKAEDRDCSWISPVVEKSLRILFRHKGEAWLAERMERSTGEEMFALYDWYVRSHDWVAILEGLLGFDLSGKKAAPSKPAKKNAVEILFELSEETEIRIEDLIGMRAEAFVSFMDAAQAVWDRKAQQYSAIANGERMLSLDEFFAEGGIPMDLLAGDGAENG